MVLTALDNTLARTAVDSTVEDVAKRNVTEESDEEEVNAADLSIIVSSDDDDEEEQVSSRKAAAGVFKPPRPAPSARPKKPPSQQAARRRRRRSSARFLRLTGRFEEDDEETQEEDTTPDASQEHLGEMYKRAIRMNAENRINAGNSWGLRLIENIDKFLVDEEQQDASPSSQEPRETQEKRVNFTKASCTLDASVKIYSYRVDDVHLTSYKVLANLNRTETGKKNSRSQDQEEEGEEGETRTTGKATSTSNERRGVTETLETNIANLNMSKLDSAFDIDPLFHKMSKTFDEGGAKGLLLVNLGVGSNGCNIVFDSKEEAASIAQDDDNAHVSTSRPEGTIDISSLTTKLDTMLGGESLESIPLVPQLKRLRQEYEQLESEGFVDHNSTKTKSRRYATSQEEEKEAEMSIHQEALERSRASQGTLAQHAMSEAGDSYAPDDFGGGDDDDDDFGFTDFIAADENGGRYSSISFQEETFVDDGPPGSTETKSNTTALLDAICSGEALGGNDYEFFNAATVEKLSAGNVWAGSAHWKKTEKLRKKRTAPSKKGTKQRKKKVSKKRGYVDLSKAPCLDDVLRAAPKSKRGTDPLQLSKAAKTKHGKIDNLLPPDAGIGMEQLSTLFLRPNTVLGKVDESREKAKTVGFQDTIESFGAGFDYGGDDDSYGGGDDGPGFTFADTGDDDEFVINELEGVRKIDKIQVGYATVAKKVDVKRLKKDLWNELEATFAPAPPVEVVGGDDSMQDNDEIKSPAPPASDEPKCLSFKETVKYMEANQPQGDVTLPFYFICLLHLANEKGLRLESTSLEDFVITTENGAAPSFGTLPTEGSTGESATTIAEQRERRAKAMSLYVDSDDEEDDETESDSD